MGAPVETGIENFEEVILGLSREDRAKLADWISETLVEEESVPATVSNKEQDSVWPPENLRVAEDSSAITPWHEAIDPPGAHLSTEEWEARVDSVAGLWSDLPDDYGDDIVTSRTISTREINLDD
jgi:hypothetical protein